MITDIDFIIFSYLPTREILKIFEFYFDNSQIKDKKILNLNLGNRDIIKNIEQKYPVIVKCKHQVNPKEISWARLSMNPNAIELLKQNPDKINWLYLSGNPNAIELLSENLDMVN